MNTLFDLETPTPVADAPTIPPTPRTPVALAEPLGVCCKSGCEQVATLKSPGGSIYCADCGQCRRIEVVMNGDKVALDMHGRAVTRRVCWNSVEDFVWCERLKMHVCPCVAEIARAKVKVWATNR